MTNDIHPGNDEVNDENAGNDHEEDDDDNDPRNNV